MAEATVESRGMSGPSLRACRAEGARLVTAAVPAAAAAGVEAFQAGGNAFDAVVAAALVETVWLPMKCGLAGDAMVLLRRAGGPVEAWFSIGAGPAGLNAADALEETGPRSVGCPGAPEAYTLLASWGRLGSERPARTAARQADAGVEWLPVAVDLTREAADLLRCWNAQTPYLPDDDLPAPGDRLALPGMAHLLDRFASDGAGLFHGDIGAALVERVAPSGNPLGPEDLRRSHLMQRQPDETVLPDGTQLLTTPAPSYGRVLADAMASATAAGVAGAAGQVAATLAARSRFDARAEGGTSVVTAADDEGNVAVLVHSNSFPQYGSGVVLSEFDLVLNNRPGRGFATGAGPDHWNAPAAGRPPATTLQAWMLSTPDGPWREHWGATPGGQNQTAWNLQAIQTLLRDGPEAAAQAPRWGLTRGGLVVERNLDGARELAERPDARLCAEGELRSVVQIVSLPRRPGPAQAVADPRTGAVARAAS